MQPTKFKPHGPRRRSRRTSNGARLYYERRGAGSSVLFISGATGDAGHWTGVADVLASEYTVITYDRRGNSRGPRPAGWTTTTIDEQADDTAALLGALDLAPAIVFGTSVATGVLAAVCLRHPEVLRGAIFHEPLCRSAAGSAPVFVKARSNWLGRRGRSIPRLRADGMGNDRPPSSAPGTRRYPSRPPRTRSSLNVRESGERTDPGTTHG